MELERELQTYAANKEQLLASAGKFVVISGDEVAGLWDTYEDALRDAYRRYGVDTRFLVKRIEGLERVQFFSGQLPCPS